MKSACAAEPLLATKPIASGITGNVVRVCGQSLIGA